MWIWVPCNDVGMDANRWIIGWFTVSYFTTRVHLIIILFRYERATRHILWLVGYINVVGEWCHRAADGEVHPPLISLAVDSYQQSLQPAGLHASIHLAYGRRSIGHSPPRPETEAPSRVRISGITRSGSATVYLFLVHGCRSGIVGVRPGRWSVSAQVAALAPPAGG